MASLRSTSGESGESISEQSLSSSLSTSGSDESELNKSRGPEHGAIEPYMFEPVASESGESDHDESEVEERRDNTDWYGLNNCIHPMLHLI